MRECLRTIHRYALNVDFTQIVTMLRRTNRLKQLLASHGKEMSLYNALGREVIPPSGIVEAECSLDQQSQLSDFSGLFDLLTVARTEPFAVKKIVQREFAPEQQTGDWERHVAVLWLSDTAFVTGNCLPTSRTAHLVNKLFEIEVGRREECLHVYILVNQGQVDSETPLEFIARLVQPTQFRCHSHVCIKFGTAPRVDTALSLVPTTAHKAAQGTKVVMKLPSLALLQALAVYPKHPNVTLEIWLKHGRPDFQIRSGMPRSTLQYMSLQSHQHDFSYFCKDLQTLAGYAPLVVLRSLRSNSTWDSLVAPTLVLQWVHQQQGGLPPKHLLGLAIKSLNQGSPNRLANNLRPSNLAAANATAIFALLNRPEFGE
jgi:hypothetical protein